MGKAFGAMLNSSDNRDIHIAAAVAPRPHQASNITDISMLPVEDQRDKGTCVGQAEGKGEEYRDFRETGKVTRLSKGFIYRECKKRDGYSGQGTAPRVAAQVLMELGVPREELMPDDNSLAYDAYMTLTASPDALKDAQTRRAAGYAFCYTLDDLKQAVDVAGVMNATIMVGGWEGIPLQRKPKAGLHRILVYGYEDVFGDTRIYFRNSWGDSWGEIGNAWFMWSEYSDELFDMMVYTDLPNNVLEEAQKIPFQFVSNRELYDKALDVIEIQKRLSVELDVRGLPCYDLKRKGVLHFGHFFGVSTARALRRYQAANGLTVTGHLDPQTVLHLNRTI